MEKEFDEMAEEILKKAHAEIDQAKEYDRPGKDGRWPIDGHSEAWHGYFILTHALAYLRNTAELIRKLNEDDRFYTPVFTREGPNYKTDSEEKQSISGK